MTGLHLRRRLLLASWGRVCRALAVDQAAAYLDAQARTFPLHVAAGQQARRAA